MFPNKPIQTQVRIKQPHSVSGVAGIPLVVSGRGNRLLFAISAVLFVSAFSWSADWAMFRGNPQNTGLAEGTIAKKLQPIWSFETSDGIESTAAIVGNRVFITSLDGTIYALSLEDGHLLWKVAVDDEIKSSPTVHQGRVYFGDEAGIFHVLDIEDGKKIWEFATEGGIVSSANFHGEQIYFGSYDAKIYGLSLRDGRKLWDFETDGYVHSTPSLMGENMTVAGCDGMLRLVNGPEGRELFALPLDGYVAGTAAVRGNYAYVGTFENQVVCVDTIKKAIRWIYQNPKRQFPFYSSPAIVGNKILIGGRDKMFHALDADTGTLLWAYHGRARIDASPVVVGDVVICADTAGKLFMLKHEDGAKVWEFETGSGIAASPAVAHGRLVIGLANGTLLCFSEKKE